MPLILNTSPISPPIHDGDETQIKARLVPLGDPYGKNQAHLLNFNIHHKTTSKIL